MKIAITGGHLAPAVAVIEALQKEKNKVVFFGRKHAFDGDMSLSFEYQTVKRLGIPFHEIETGKIKRHFTLDAVKSLTKVPKGLRSTTRLLKEEKPDILLTFGGYLSIPVAICARMQGIPIVIHEQTQNSGMANRFVAKFATKICISFESSKRYFPKGRTVVTGNPLRPEIFTPGKRFVIPPGKKIIYITGGSTGAHKINMLVKEALNDLLKDFVVIHQTGDTTLTNDYISLQDLRKSLPEDEKESYILKKFVEPDELAWIYKNADVVVARSGINTTLELITTKSVALLIPLKVGQKDEQLKNAKYYEKTGLGIYHEQEGLTPEKFLSDIARLVKESSTRKKNAKTQSYPDNPAQQIVNILISIYEAKRGEKT